MNSLLLALGCGGGGLISDAAVTGEDYASLSGDQAWTWRQELPAADTGDLDLDETLLLHGRYSEGSIELRRGTRWADAQSVGSIQFSQPNGGVQLESWELDGATGSGAMLALEQPESGIATPDCDTVVGLEVETFYGLFQRTLTADCGKSGVWSFEYGVGLIQVQAEELTLDLVAPY